MCLGAKVRSCTIPRSGLLRPYHRSVEGQPFFTTVAGLSVSLAGFGARWRFMTVAGVLAAISTNISYWNWYGFPTNYTLAYTFTIVMGFVFAGLVAAAIVKPGAGMPLAEGVGA